MDYTLSDSEQEQARHALNVMPSDQIENGDGPQSNAMTVDATTRTENGEPGADVFNDLEDIDYTLSEHREEEMVFLAACELHSRIGNNLGFANALEGLGESYRAQLRYQEGEKAFKEAHEIYLRIGNDRGAADAMVGLGEIYRAQSKYQEAESMFRDAHKIHSGIGNELNAANALISLGETFLTQLKYPESEMAFEEAYRIYSRIGHSQGVVDASNHLEDIRRAQSRTNKYPESFETNVGLFITWISPSPINMKGHFCDLYEGTHKTFGKVALKRPRGGSSDDSVNSDIIRRFEREASIWKKLKHPHILEFIGTFKKDGHLYLVSPFINNGSVVEYVVRFPSINKIKLLQETADAIRYLHTQEIVHGDIKANNILISDSDERFALLCDFGLTKEMPSATSTSMKGTGTIRWMAPELWDNAARSFETDVYSFGMTIAEVLTDKVPLSHISVSDEVAFMMAVMNEDERPSMDPTCSPDGISYAVAWSVARECWSRNPSERISMSEAFRRLIADS